VNRHTRRPFGNTMSAVVEPQKRQEPSTCDNRGSRAQPTRVLLADDNPVIIELIRELLEPAFDVVGAVNDGQSVLSQASALNPDVIVLDISMGEPDGIAVARQLQETACHFKVVFVSVHEIAEFIRSALAAGGAAYVFKSRLRTDLIPAIHAACAGKLFVSCRRH
jgi:DNA-binding NarL/FixJ family response regulator